MAASFGGNLQNFGGGVKLDNMYGMPVEAELPWNLFLLLYIAKATN